MTKLTRLFASSIQRKILSSFAIVILLVLVMVSVGYYQLNQVRVSVRQIPEESSQLAALQELILALTSLEANLERFFVIGGTQFQEDMYADLETMATSFKLYAEGATQVEDDQVIQQIEGRLNSLHRDIDALLDASYDELKSRELNEKIITIYSEIATIKKLGQEMSIAELRELQASALQQSNVTSNVMIQFLVLGILSAIAIVAASLVVTRSIAKPLASLAQTANLIAEGNIEAEMPVIGQQDEVGQLGSALESMTTQLRQFIGSLEDQVNERTSALVTSMEVGQQAAAIRELDELLPTIVEFIRNRFELYYVHVYFKDDVGKNLTIVAGTGHMGQELLDRNHTLPIGTGSIVGQVAATGQPIVVSDTKASLIHRPNSLLPDTRSELAVPLIVEREVIGVLDMQSDQENTFTEDNMTVFEAMATQLAISIDSAQQWAASREAQRQSEEALRRLTRETWSEQLQRRKVSQLGYLYNLSGIRPLSEGSGSGDISAPVVVQSQPIGQLSVAVSQGNRATEDEFALVQAVAQQLSQKAENLRLFDETQQRATREQIARQITDRIRASRDIDTALKTAAEELSKALGTSKAVIDLRMTPENE